MPDTDRLAIAAHLHVLLRRKTGRVTDTEWMAANADYALEIVRFARQRAQEDDVPELAEWAARLEQAVHAAPPQQIFGDEQRTRYLIGRFDLELFRDEVENYHLNLTSPEPRVFVMWRMEDDLALPVEVSLSYGEAARWLDSGEQCDGVPMPAEIADWLGDFVNTHYKPAPRKKLKRNDPFAGKARP